MCNELVQSIDGSSHDQCTYTVDASNFHLFRKHERAGRVDERSSPPGYMDIPPKEDVRLGTCSYRIFSN